MSAESTIVGAKKLGEEFQKYMINEFPSDNVKFSKSMYSPVLMEMDIGLLAPYFKFLQNGFSNFNPTLKTPNQILDEVKEASFIEIFETASGTLVVRTPKYNDVTTLLFSSNFNVISSTYSDQIKGIVSKEKLTYFVDLIKDLPFNIFTFTNGKLLLQYGLTETEASANPNVKYTKETSANVEVNTDLAIFNYARFFLELNNASQKTSSITLEYEPATTTIKGSKTGESITQAFGIGNLFFDEVNSKVSYVTNISKTCKIGGELSMVVTGAFVRDGFTQQVQSFSELPSLEDFSPELGSSTPTTLVQGMPELSVPQLPITQVIFRPLPELIDLNRKFSTVAEAMEADQKEQKAQIEITSGVTKVGQQPTNTTSVYAKGK
jgi:hypothetical protein